MNTWQADPVFPHDLKTLRAYDELCQSQGIAREQEADCIFVIRDSSDHVIAGGCLFGKTLRSLVTHPDYRGEGLMAIIVEALLNQLRHQGIYSAFILGKNEYLETYRSLGFYLLSQGKDQAVFLENHPHRFSDWLEDLRKETETQLKFDTIERKSTFTGETASLVMNLNPITRGHLKLIQQTAETYAVTHLFLLENQRSFFSTEERLELLKLATQNCLGLVIHLGGDYMISESLFPGYFLREANQKALVEADLDAHLFSRIAHALNIQHRVLGEEPFLELGRLYNRQLKETLTESGVKVQVLPRYEDERGVPYSATRVRQAIAEGNWAQVYTLIPEDCHPWFRDREKELYHRAVQRGNL